MLNRAFELEGIPSVMTTWRDGVARLAKAPRVTFTKLPRGASIGSPHDEAQQRRVLEATFALFNQAAPIKPVVLDETLTE
ncbi:MAG: hypothetical protein AAF846_08945 [Chloroflexota bacterium]